MKTTRVFLAVATAAVLWAAGSVPLAAQTTVVRQQAGLDPAIQRIWRLGEDSSHVQQLAQVLFDSLGPRLMGSAEIKHAQDWLTAQYKSWGIDAKEEQYRDVARVASRRVAHRSRFAQTANARRDDDRLEPGHRRTGCHR